MPTTLPSPWSSAETFEFADVRLVDTDVASAVDALVEAATAKSSQGLHLCNAYTLALALHDTAYREVLSHDAAVNLPDGTPVAWYYRLSSHRRAKGPVRGPTLMKAVLARPGLSHYLLGGTPRVLDDLEARIARGYPAAKVVGRHSPPFGDPSAADIGEFAAAIRASNADVVWVGLGTPRQDVVISQLVGRVDAVLVGVGAAFDFLSGHKSEAPEFLHRTGLEWVYRLASEPRRLWRRYLVGNSLFIAAAVRQLPGARRAAALQSSARSPRRVRVGAALVDCLEERDAIEAVLQWAESTARPRLVVTPNIQHIALLETDPQLRAAYARADLVLPDGWPVVRAARLRTRSAVHRITGADLFPALCARAAERGLRVGIVGGMHGAAVEAARVLGGRHPGLDVVLTLEPEVGFERHDASRQAVVDSVREAKLDLLFLALGAPKQETFAVAHLDEMAAGVTLCVGAAVDFVAGRQRRAPQVLRRLGLEWAHRAVHEPRRLVPRYARSAPVFVRAVYRARRRERP